ncbi:MAG: hypothetical protein NTW59_00430 [Candidatus Diapherotrites archaeon]|nr:hypothetical protein [Candidatus Diapherotrites archaeon]
MSFLRVLADSFSLLLMCPRFFIPKILVSFFFFPIIVLLPAYFVHLNVVPGEALIERGAIDLIVIALQVIFLMVYTIAVCIIDSFLTNPMYPVLVKQFYEKKEINFRKALIDVLTNFGTIFPTVLVFSILLIISMMPFLMIMATSFVLHSVFLFYLAIVVALVSIFVMFVLFYLIYPVSSLEKIGFAKAIRQTVHSSLKHKREVTMAFAISVLITLASYLIAFEIFVGKTNDVFVTILFFSLLVLARFLVAVFSTYQQVLNAVFYLHLEKGIFLKK